ncbi:MAG: hypothetical protein ACTS8S_08960 [Giesbergeria sp.]
MDTAQHVHRTVAIQHFTDDEVLRLAASLDQRTEHPLAAAIVSAANEKELKLSKPGQFDFQSGIGVRCMVTGKSLALGNTALVKQLGVAVDTLHSRRPRNCAVRAPACCAQRRSPAPLALQ